MSGFRVTNFSLSGSPNLAFISSSVYNSLTIMSSFPQLTNINIKKLENKKIIWTQLLHDEITLTILINFLILSHKLITTK